MSSIEEPVMVLGWLLDLIAGSCCSGFVGDTHRHGIPIAIALLPLV